MLVKIKQRNKDTGLLKCIFFVFIRKRKFNTDGSVGV